MMAYVPGVPDYWTWYAAFQGTGADWALRVVEGISRAEVAHVEESA